jgi:hypothetical protein
MLVVGDRRDGVIQVRSLAVEELDELVDSRGHWKKGRSFASLRDDI